MATKAPMSVLTREWIKHLNQWHSLAKGHAGVQWFPKKITGDNSLPADYELPWGHNPLPQRQITSIRGHRLPQLEKDTHRLRYLLYLRATKQMESVDQWNELVDLSGKVCFTGQSYQKRNWPQGWYPKLIKAIESGMSFLGAIAMLKLPQTTMIALHTDIPQMKADVLAALAARQSKLVSHITDIALRGENQREQLKATMFLLERRYGDEFGPKQSVEISRPTSPMAALLSRIGKTEREE